MKCNNITSSQEILFSNLQNIDILDNGREGGVTRNNCCIFSTYFPKTYILSNIAFVSLTRFTVVSCKARCACAGVLIYSVNTFSAILTWTAQTFIDVCGKNTFVMNIDIIGTKKVIMTCIIFIL